jgi:hypothetical protein
MYMDTTQNSLVRLHCIRRSLCENKLRTGSQGHRANTTETHFFTKLSCMFAIHEVRAGHRDSPAPHAYFSRESRANRHGGKYKHQIIGKPYCLYI